MSRDWAGGSTYRWRRIRAGVLARNRADNGGRCTAGIVGVCTGEADQVHHIHGKAVTGDDPRFLAAVCRACNLKIGSPGKHNPKPRPRSTW